MTLSHAPAMPKTARSQSYSCLKVPMQSMVLKHLAHDYDPTATAGFSGPHRPAWRLAAGRIAGGRQRRSEYRKAQTQFCPVGRRGERATGLSFSFCLGVRVWCRIGVLQPLRCSQSDHIIRRDGRHDDGCRPGQCFGILHQGNDALNRPQAHDNVDDWGVRLCVYYAQSGMDLSVLVRARPWRTVGRSAVAAVGTPRHLLSRDVYSDRITHMGLRYG